MIMRYFAVIKIAFRALRRNKMRTVLTMLGIIIGVAAVIAMVALGLGPSAESHHRDDRGDADDDAEHGQHRPHFVPAQRAKGDFDDGEVTHGSIGKLYCLLLLLQPA